MGIYCQLTVIYPFAGHFLLMSSFIVLVIAGVRCSTEVNRQENSLLVTYSDVGVLPAQTWIPNNMVALYSRAL